MVVTKTQRRIKHILFRKSRASLPGHCHKNQSQKDITTRWQNGIALPSVLPSFKFSSKSVASPPSTLPLP